MEKDAFSTPFALGENFELLKNWKERFEKRSFENIQYLIRYPKNYQAGNQYPILFYFHGSGSRGTDVECLKKNDYFILENIHEGLPFISIAPQCHEDSWFEMWETVKKFVQEVTGFDFCDHSRVYVTGVSMGGYAAWQIGMSLPWMFAAMVPVCGGGMYWNAERLRNIPIRAFHGEKDDIVRVRESENMVNAIKGVGGNATLTVVPNVGHNVWLNVYSNIEIFQWLLVHKK